ncbi:sigma-70 family RNA polymerase sigma factor [Paraclostridium ghonii]|uniref:sigma-70 family RNA polymerase sigma factor n=1 Tax=Paraclostridium ghonii TaxID=29358 RepID=UPI00202CD2F3|nr:sigma-70 family RNA polymerase sigma factor [Paeniclostridium ghonii]
MTFEEVFKNNYIYVFKHIMQKVKDPEIAENIAQEAFIQLYKTNWQEIDNHKAWLIKTAIYISYNHFRTEKRHQARVIKAGSILEFQDGQTLDDKYIRKEEIKNVRKSMDELNEQDKKLLLLRYSGLKYKEIAKILNVETTAIGTMLVRAQNKFKKIYIKNREE